MIKKYSYSTWAVILIFAFSIIKFLYSLTLGANSGTYLALHFGPLPFIYLVLVLVALISIFSIDSKYKWLIVSVPFIWKLCLPLSINSALPLYGFVYQLYALIPHGIFNNLYYIISQILFYGIMVYYLVSNFKEKSFSKNIDIIIAILIILLFFV